MNTHPDQLTEENIAKALSIVESAIMDMAEAGLEPLMRATALALHLKEQVALGAGSKQAERAILNRLVMM
jgi:hypothetical protein